MNFQRRARPTNMNLNGCRQLPPISLWYMSLCCRRLQEHIVLRWWINFCGEKSRASDDGVLLWLVLKLVARLKDSPPQFSSTPGGTTAGVLKRRVVADRERCCTRLATADTQTRAESNLPHQSFSRSKGPARNHGGRVDRRRLSCCLQD